MSPREGTRLIDLLIVGALLMAAAMEIAIGTGNGPTGLLIAVSALSIVPLAWRRTRPDIAGAATVAAQLVPVLFGEQADSLTLLVANLVAIHAVNAYGSRRVAVGYTAAILGSVLLSVVVRSDQVIGDFIWTLVIYALGATAGQVTAAHARSAMRLHAASERAAIDAERRTLAADLHDTVAHGVALMVVQAGAAATVLRSDPDRALRMLEAVQAAGERTAVDLDHMLAAINPERPSVSPTLGLSDIPDLIAQVQRTGATVKLTTTGDLTLVSAGVGTSAYRVVQEALTNAVKHGKLNTFTVGIAVDSPWLEITVVEGTGSNASWSEPRVSNGSATTGGHGLAAMRERVETLGGTIKAGRTVTGWAVHASIPLVTPATASR